MPWNPDHYNRFADARAAPFEDMLRLIHVRAGLRVLLHETAREEPALSGCLRPIYALPLADYVELLFRHDGHTITAFEKVYPTVLENVEAAIDPGAFP